MAKRGLDIARTAELFEEATLTITDDRKDYGELRQITIGFLDSRMVVMVWAQRGEKCRSMDRGHFASAVFRPYMRRSGRLRNGFKTYG